jgi:hypothetical protein
MRKEGVHSLMLNVPLFKELKFEIAQDARYVRFAVPTKTSIEHYNLRVSDLAPGSLFFLITVSVFDCQECGRFFGNRTSIFTRMRFYLLLGSAWIFLIFIRQ